MRPREELLETVGMAFDAYFHVLVHGDFSYINQFIDKITQMRMEAVFLLSDVQKAFELYRNILIPLLAKENTITTIEDFCDNIVRTNRCLAYTIHRLSDHFQDMHEKKALEDHRRLEEAERLAALGEMANRVAHELRNPMTVVGGFTRRLYDKMAADDPDRKYLAIVIEAVMAIENSVSKIIKLEEEED
jgi:signal transduction histidine kinase